LRSSLIFKVSAKFENRYLLCRTVSISARKMHRDGASISQSINRSLQALHDVELPGKKSVPPLETGNQVSTEVEAGTMVAP
jgi:hypothetical protein